MQITNEHPMTRPRLNVTDKNLDVLLAGSWNALHRWNCPPQAFLHEGKMVRLVDTQYGTRIEPARSITVFGFLSRAADWVRTTRKGDMAVMPVKTIARMMVKAPDLRLPLLDEVVATPVFAADGALLTEPGYHARGSVWIAHTGIPPVSERPTELELAAARRLLLSDLLGDFEFAREADRAHALAALLLPFARRLVKGAIPVHLVGTTVPGAGKTLFVDLIDVLARGFCRMGPLEWTSAPEVREERWSDLRGRGSQRRARASVSIRLQPSSERPWLRTFRHEDLRSWAKAERPRLVHATLTLVQNWVARDCPPGLRHRDGFEGWSAVFGGILSTAGVAGFLKSDEERRQTMAYTCDDDAWWEDLIEAWWDAFRDREVRATDLVRLPTLERRFREGSERSRTTRLGRLLRAHAGRLVGEQRLEYCGNSHAKIALYRLAAQVQLH